MRRCVSRLNLCMGGNGIQSRQDLVAQREHRLQFTLRVSQGHSCPKLSRMCPKLSRMCPIRESSKAWPDKRHLENDSRQMTVTKLDSFIILVSLHDSQILLHYLPNSFSCHRLLKHVFFNLHTFVNIPAFLFLLISSLIILW